jgi:hypothetical protein
MSIYLYIIFLRTYNFIIFIGLEISALKKNEKKNNLEFIFI